MKSILIAIALMLASPAYANDWCRGDVNMSVEACTGCTCRYECWRNGECREVCRDSCGRFC
jgi:hypothetical protein